MFFPLGKEHTTSLHISEDPERVEWRKVKGVYKLKTQGRQWFLEASF